MMEARPLKLVVLDRDGVINYDSDKFIKSPAEWAPIPGSLEAIARLNQAGYRVVVSTNQSGVARRLFDISALNAIHQKMHTAGQQVGAHIDAIFFCPHAADDNCDCRKPKSGMLHAIAQRFDVSLKGVPCVGDSLRDLQSGFVVGCVPYLVLTGKGKKTQMTGGLPPGTMVLPDLAATVDYLLKQDAKPFDDPSTLHLKEIKTGRTE
jgi:D-glycero-D-manno-heptose 1,7-bisphosphate phosphatase